MKKINSVLAFFGVLLFCASLALAENKPNLPTVAIITTGGTIAEKTDPNTGGSVPALSGKDLIEAIPSLSKVSKHQGNKFFQYRQLANDAADMGKSFSRRR